MDAWVASGVLAAIGAILLIVGGIMYGESGVYPTPTPIKVVLLSGLTFVTPFILRLLIAAIFQ
jgi:hypothetical protein